MLFTYVALHLTDHALGNISLETMEAMLRAMKVLWQNPAGAVLLYGALIGHVALAFWALYEKRYFRWTAAEMVQLVLGFSIPVMLANHILSTRVSLSVYGTEKGYPAELYSFWVANIPFGIVQHLVLIVAWGHGCLGLYFWLRLKRWFRPAVPGLLAVAVLLPVLALLGSFQQGRHVQTLAQDPAWRARYLAPDQIGTDADNTTLADWRLQSWAVFAAMLAAVLAARLARVHWERRRGLVWLRYAADRRVSAPAGLTVLEISNLHGIPHMSLCGGRGRCTTCRIRIIGGSGALPPPSPAETAALQQAGAEPDVRLACQLRPHADLTLVLLMSPGAARPRRAHPLSSGEERYLVAMFVDLRGSTALAEQRLPFDTVFILNSFLTAVGRAVTEAGGQPNQMLGDGMLALFGLTTGRSTAARQALAAAAAIIRNLQVLNEQLAPDLREPLQCSIGINGGDVVTGDLGFEGHRVFTAVGDAVNVAARLQAATQEHCCDLLVADAVCRDAGLGETWPLMTLTLRGRGEGLRARRFCFTRSTDSILTE